MPHPKIEFKPSLDQADVHDILVDGKYRGSLKKCLHGPGFFLSLNDEAGKTKIWRNAAPGARIQQERDFRAKQTYVKTMKAARERVNDNL